MREEAEFRYVFDNGTSLAPGTRSEKWDDESLTYDLRPKLREAQRETKEFFKREAARKGLDWKKEYENYKQRMKRKGWRP